jgi:HAMP domain-containing protein
MGRFKWITQHPIQSKYVVIVLLAMVLPTLLLSGCMYFMIFSLLAEQLALPEGVYEVIIPMFNRVNVVLLIGMPLVFALLILVSLCVSHRFAGPIERMEHEIDQILAGNRSKKINLRKNDDLKGLAERINRLIDISKRGR